MEVNTLILFHLIRTAKDEDHSAGIPLGVREMLYIYVLPGEPEVGLHRPSLQLAPCRVLLAYGLLGAKVPGKM